MFLSQRNKGPEQGPSMPQFLGRYWQMQSWSCSEVLGQRNYHCGFQINMRRCKQNLKSLAEWSGSMFQCLQRTKHVKALYLRFCCVFLAFRGTMEAVYRPRRTSQCFHGNPPWKTSVRFTAGPARQEGGLHLEMDKARGCLRWYQIWSFFVN